MITSRRYKAGVIACVYVLHEKVCMQKRDVHLVEKAVLWTLEHLFCGRASVAATVRAVTGVARACRHVLFKVLLNTPIHTTAYKYFQGLALPLSQPHPL